MNQYRGPYALKQIEDLIGSFDYVQLELEPATVIPAPWNVGRTIAYFWSECKCEARGPEAKCTWSACMEHQHMTIDAKAMPPPDDYGGGGLWVTRDFATGHGGRSKVFRIESRETGLVIISRPI